MKNKKRIIALITSTIFLIPSHAKAGGDSSKEAPIREEFLRQLDREPIGSAYKEGQNEYSRSVYLLKGDDAKNVVSGFNSSLKKEKKEGEIYMCRSVVEEPVGHGTNSQVSYGGVCLYQENGKYIPVRICNDNIVGHFMMEDFDIRSLDFDGSLWKLTKFVFANCAGG